MSQNTNEQWRTLLKDFYEEYSQNNQIFGINSSIEFCQNTIKEYAQLTIKSLFWLNAGALIAMPAILEYAKVEINLIWNIPLLYVGGIVCTVISMIGAYLSCVASLEANSFRRSEEYSKFAIRYFTSENNPDYIPILKEEQKQAKEQKEKYYKIAWNIEILCIAFVVISLSFFLSGSICLIRGL